MLVWLEIQTPVVSAPFKEKPLQHSKYKPTEGINSLFLDILKWAIFLAILSNTRSRLSKFHGPCGPKLHLQSAVPFHREKMRQRRQRTQL